jgi:hypothetical protein
MQPTFPLSDQIHQILAILGGLILAFHPWSQGAAVLNDVQTIAGAVMVIVTTALHIWALAHVRVNAPAAPTAPASSPIAPPVAGV